MNMGKDKNPTDPRKKNQRHFKTFTKTTEEKISRAVKLERLLLFSIHFQKLRGNYFM